MKVLVKVPNIYYIVTEVDALYLKDGLLAGFLPESSLCYNKYKTVYNTTLQKCPVSCYHTLIDKQARAKLCYLHPQVCVIQPDSCGCLATGCEVDTHSSL